MYLYTDTQDHALLVTAKNVFAEYFQPKTKSNFCGLEMKNNF